MQNVGRCYTTSDFHLEYLCILERVKIPKIGKMWSTAIPPVFCGKSLVNLSPPARK